MADDPDAAAPNILGRDKNPFMFRKDHVSNMNDSYWLTNPKQPLEGFPQIIGERAQHPRTAHAPRPQDHRGPPRPAPTGARGKGFGLHDMTWAAWNNRQYAGELWQRRGRGDVQRERLEHAELERGDENVRRGLPILGAWNLRNIAWSLRRARCWRGGCGNRTHAAPPARYLGAEKIDANGRPTPRAA